MDRPTIVTIVALDEELLDWAREAEAAWDAAGLAYENAVNEEADDVEIADLEELADKAEVALRHALSNIALEVLDQIKAKSGRAVIHLGAPIDWPRFRDLAAADLQWTLCTACPHSVEYRGPRFRGRYTDAEITEILTDRQAKWRDQHKSRTD